MSSQQSPQKSSAPAPSSPAAGPQAAPGGPGAAKFILFAVVTVVFTIFDQATKIWIQRNVALYREEIPVIDGLLSIVHAENPGAAFGLLSDSEHRMWIFAAFTIVAVIVLLQMLWQLPKNDRYQTFALGLITSGAIGNGIDRIQKQSVTDFVKVYTESPGIKAFLVDKFGTNEWPSFNVADAAIVVGLGMFLVHFLFLQKDEEVEPDPPKKPLDTDVVAPAGGEPSRAPSRVPSSASASLSARGAEPEPPPEAIDVEAPTEMVDPQKVREMLKK